MIEMLKNKYETARRKEGKTSKRGTGGVRPGSVHILDVLTLNDEELQVKSSRYEELNSTGETSLICIQPEEHTQQTQQQSRWRGRRSEDPDYSLD